VHLVCGGIVGRATIITWCKNGSSNAILAADRRCYWKVIEACTEGRSSSGRAGGAAPNIVVRERNHREPPGRSPWHLALNHRIVVILQRPIALQLGAHPAMQPVKD
jgi:hypothetical protein